MKKLIFILFPLLFAYMSIYSQPWLKYLPANKSTDKLTLFDYQNAFNKEWTGIDVKNGWYIDKNGVKQKAAGWKQFQRWNYFWQSRVNPITGEFPQTDAYTEFIKMKNKGYYKTNTGNWTCLGTNSSDGGYAGIGRINVVAFHPTNDNIFWIGAPAGGLWQTTDAGQTWQVLTDYNAVLGVSAIAIPSDYDVSQTIYIGTGDRDAFDNTSVGVLKSKDGGQTWQTTGLSFAPSAYKYINDLIISPKSNAVLFAATSGGFYISTDSAATWLKTSSNAFIDIELCPGFEDTIYGATKKGKIYRSLDSGKTWSIQFTTDGLSRVELAVSKKNPAVIYALSAAADDGLDGIYKSTNYGSTFTKIYSSTNLLGWYDGTDAGGQGWYDLSMAVDPNNINNLFIGGVNTWKSTNGGTSWTLANHWYGGYNAQAVHADKHELRFRNNTSTLFEANDGGVYTTTDGTNWTDLSNGITNSQIYGLSTAQTTPNMVVVGLQDNGTKLESSNVWADVLGGDGMKCKIDYANELTQYGSTPNGNFYRTDNAWASNVSINPTGSGKWVTPIVIDPIDHNTIYIGYDKLWKSTNKGSSYTSIGNFGTLLDNIAISPSDNKYIYVSYNTTIYVTKDGGINWTDISNSFTYPITCITVKNDDPQTVWITQGGYSTGNNILESTDAGTTWHDISNGLPSIPVNCIIQNNIETFFTQLYAATDFGVYVKNGTDSTWELYSNGLPNVVVSELDIYYDFNNINNSKLRASTYGRGLWESNLQLSGKYAPIVETDSVSNITLSSANLYGTLSNTFGTPIDHTGILISTNNNPELGQNGVINIECTDTIDNFTVHIDTLTPATRYYYRAYGYNQYGIGYGTVKNFSSGCDAKVIPWSENFEHNMDFPACFDQKSMLNNYLWQISNNNNSHPASAHSSSYFTFISGSSTSPAKAVFYSPIINLSNIDAAKVSFWAYNAPKSTKTDTLKVYYLDSTLNQWTNLITINQALSSWTEFHIQLPSLSSIYQLKFEGSSKYGYGFAIDDISVYRSTTSLENTDNKDIDIFPNPANDYITVKFDNQESKTLTIYDISGKVVSRTVTNLINPSINIENLQKGIYIIDIQSLGNQIIKKFVKD